MLAYILCLQQILSVFQDLVQFYSSGTTYSLTLSKFCTLRPLDSSSQSLTALITPNYCFIHWFLLLDCEFLEDRLCLISVLSGSSPIVWSIVHAQYLL